MFYYISMHISCTALRPTGPTQWYIVFRAQLYVTPFLVGDTTHVKKCRLLSSYAVIIIQGQMYYILLLYSRTSYYISVLYFHYSQWYMLQRQCYFTFLLYCDTSYKNRVNLLPSYTVIHQTVTRLLYLGPLQRDILQRHCYFTSHPIQC